MLGKILLNFDQIHEIEYPLNIFLAFDFRMKAYHVRHVSGPQFT